MMNETAAPARPPTLRQLEARAVKAKKARVIAAEKFRRAHRALDEAFAAYEAALSDETLARGSLALSREGKTAEPAPPAPETLTGADEED
jgi:hypothetical protein